MRQTTRNFVVNVMWTQPTHVPTSKAGNTSPWVSTVVDNYLSNPLRGVVLLTKDPFVHIHASPSIND
jgi:hypothetical protein